jgi:hypothetical protein
VVILKAQVFNSNIGIFINRANQLFNPVMAKVQVSHMAFEDNPIF